MNTEHTQPTEPTDTAHPTPHACAGARDGEDPAKPSRAVTRLREWKPLFLAALTKTGDVRASCAAAAVHWDTAYSHQKRDKQFAKAWTSALRKYAPPFAPDDLDTCPHCGKPLTGASPTQTGGRP